MLRSPRGFGHRLALLLDDAVDLVPHGFGNNRFNFNDAPFTLRFRLGFPVADALGAVLDIDALRAGVLQDAGQARWPEATASLSDLTLELLAFIEGRFLTIHPFSDFNGRTIRLFRREVLRRMDFPRVILEPDTDAGRASYFSALEAADRSEFHELADIWKSRLNRVETPEV
ncbi:MAG: hypothetical protein ABIZ04_13155 [Opitutus sp.]